MEHLTGNGIFFLNVPVAVSYFVLGASLAVVFTAVGGGASPWQFALTGFVTVVIILCLNMVGQGVLLMGDPRLLFGAAVIERVLQLAIAAASPLLAGLFGLAWYVVWMDGLSRLRRHHDVPDLRVAEEGVDAKEIASVFD